MNTADLETAFRRVLKLPASQPARLVSVQAARQHLRRNGWTQVAAAKKAGVTREHTALVLNGHRESNRLLKFILSLPENPDPA